MNFQALRIHTVGGRPELRFEQLGLDDLDAGDVVVRVAYSAVNYKDAMAACGIGKNVRAERPCVGGIEMSGIVVRSADPNVREGDRVIVGSSGGFGASHDGGFAEFCRVKPDWVVQLPRGLSLRDAMVIGGAGVTAALSVDRMEACGLAPGRGPVAVTGATGGVGSLAIDLLSGRGYSVEAVTGKLHAVDYLKQLGAERIMSTEELLSRKEVLCSARWAGAVENVGGQILDRIAANMMPHGQVAVIGMAVGYDLKTTVLPLVLRSVSLLGINASRVLSIEERRRIWQRLATDLKPRHLDKILRLTPFADLPSAFQNMIDSKITGRLVVEIGGDADQHKSHHADKRRG